MNVKRYFAPTAREALRALKRRLPEAEAQDALDQAAFSRSDPTLRESWRALDDAADGAIEWFRQHLRARPAAEADTAAQ